MSKEMVKLTMEVEVPKDQLPPGYTGRLSWRVPKKGEIALDPVGVYETYLVGKETITAKRPVVEVHLPWRVPDYLRDKLFNRMLLKRDRTHSGDNAWALYVMSEFGKDELYAYVSNHTTGPTTLGQILRFTVADFEQMDANKCYQLGEGAE